MKLGPIFTAICVCAAIYAYIMEREALLAFAGIEPDPEENTAEIAEVSDAVPVQVMKSSAQYFQSGIPLRGRTEAFRSVDVSAEISGTVISQPLRKGHIVEEGETLCQLDPGTLEAALAEARANLAEARTNNNVSATLVERGFASETTVISRQAALESAEAAVERAKEDLARLTIKAPFDGILETDTAELGALLQPGAPCATIISLDPVKLVGFVTEEQIPNLSVGAPASARLITGEELVGELTFIARTSDPQTRTFQVEVTVPNLSQDIRYGITAEIFIELPNQLAHLLPQSALTLDDDGRLGVRTVEKNIAKFYPVNILHDNADGVWVTGLANETDVIVIGQEYVNNGREVAPTFIEEDS